MFNVAHTFQCCSYIRESRTKIYSVISYEIQRMCFATKHVRRTRGNHVICKQTYVSNLFETISPPGNKID